MQKQEEPYSSLDWYRTWFDTKYYHSLYSHRDEEEAEAFILALLKRLDVPEGARVMDLACGKGRHAITMFDYGLEVVGLDLSENSIAHLQSAVRPGLEFHQWDMRDPYKEQAFDYIFNLFTSFGYFKDVKDNLRVLESVAFGLKPDGLFVLDYLNAASFPSSGASEEVESEIDGYRFRTSKKIEGGMVVKMIEVLDGDEQHHFEERVQLFRLADMETMMRDAGLRIKKVYGSYSLNDFNETESDRLILVAEKA